MRKLIPCLVAAALLTGACGGSDASGPTVTCALKLDVEDAPVLFVGRSAPLHATVTYQSGKCTPPSTIPSALDWTSSRPDIVQVTSVGDTTATAIAKQLGTSVVRASLKTQPNVADSITVAVATQATVVPINE